MAGRSVGPVAVTGRHRSRDRRIRPLIADQPVEIFGVACLSTRYHLLAWHLLSRGTRVSTPVSMPDVFLPACLTPGTTGLMVVHNHPSGDPQPSQQDIKLTREIVEACRHLRISVHDHVIIGTSGHSSLRAMGLI